MRKWIVALGVMMIIAVGVSAGILLAQDDSPAATPDAAPSAPWLGVGVIESSNQVVIAQVQPGSPAETAQLAVGDVIISFNGNSVTSISALANDVLAANSGDTVTLDLLHKGKALMVDVVLASATPSVTSATQNFGLDPLVVTGTLLSAQFSAVATGYQVTAINATNPFKLEVGDVVMTIDGQSVPQLNLTLLQQHLGTLALPLLTIKVMRAGTEVTLQGAPPVGSLNFGRPGNQEDAREGGHRDDRNGGEGGGEGGEGGEGNPILVAPSGISATPEIQPASTLPADTFSQI